MGAFLNPLPARVTPKANRAWITGNSDVTRLGKDCRPYARNPVGSRTSSVRNPRRSLAASPAESR